MTENEKYERMLRELKWHRDSDIQEAYDREYIESLRKLREKIDDASLQNFKNFVEIYQLFIEIVSIGKC